MHSKIIPVNFEPVGRIDCSRGADLACRKFLIYVFEECKLRKRTSEVNMANKSRNKLNQPPTGQGKKQSPKLGAPQKLDKRSEVLQAQRNHPELNMGTNEDEAARGGSTENPKRRKAGR